MLKRPAVQRVAEDEKLQDLILALAIVRRRQLFWRRFADKISSLPSLSSTASSGVRGSQGGSNMHIQPEIYHHRLAHCGVSITALTLPSPRRNTR